MTYAEYYNEHWAEARTESADYTFGEEVWNAARRDLEKSEVDLEDI